MPLINISGLANGVSFWPMCVFTGVIHNLVPSRYLYFNIILHIKSDDSYSFRGRDPVMKHLMPNRLLGEFDLI